VRHSVVVWSRVLIDIEGEKLRTPERTAYLLGSYIPLDDQSLLICEVWAATPLSYPLFRAHLPLIAPSCSLHKPVYRERPTRREFLYG